MFNAEIYRKKLHEKKLLDVKVNKYMKDENKRKNDNIERSANYKRRVEGFVLNMMDNPIVNKDWSSIHMEKNNIFRDENPQKNVGPSNIIFSLNNYRTEKDRIKANASENRRLYAQESCPQIYNFRPRNHKKEIHDDMRFKFSTAIERIRNEIENSNYIPHKQNYNKKKYNKKNDEIFVDYVVNRPMLSPEIIKSLYPELNRKTHFKAATSLYLQLPDSLKDMKKKNDDLPEKTLDTVKEADDQNYPANATLEGDQSPVNLKNFKQRKGDKHDALETALPSNLVKDTLLKCNYLKKPNPNVEQLHPGNGLFFGDPAVKIHEIYESILLGSKNTKSQNTKRTTNE